MGPRAVREWYTLFFAKDFPHGGCATELLPATMRTLVVLPTYNEAPTIESLCGTILEKDPSLDVLVVDDNSPDGTGTLVEKAMREQPRLRLLSRERKLGLGSACLAGFRHALDRGYDHVITMDCDLSHDPGDLPRILAARDRCDMVIGSRYVEGGGILDWAFHRRALSAFANLYTRVLLRLPIRDCTSGYRCYSRRVLETVDPFSVRGTGYSFLEEMVWRVHAHGFRIAEVPIVFEGRRLGSSKIDRKEIFRAAWHVLAARFAPSPLGTKRGDGARGQPKEPPGD